MSKKTGLIAIIIALAAVCLAAAALYKSVNPSVGECKDVQYVMYLGANDKDTNQPCGTEEEIKAKTEEILTKYFEGFTMQDAFGGWTNKDGSVAHEYTIVILLSDTTSEKVHAAADELLKEFNQSTILIQTNETVTEFYSGSN